MNSTEEVLGELLKEASDPTTPAHRLDDIAWGIPRIDYEPEHVLVEDVRRALMINPNLDVCLIRRLLAQEKMRMRVVQNPAIPMYLMTGELDLTDFGGIIETYLFNDAAWSPRAKLVPIVEDWIGYVVAPKSKHWVGNLKTLQQGKAVWPSKDNVRCLLRNVFVPGSEAIQPPQVVLYKHTLWASVQPICRGEKSVFSHLDALLGFPRASRRPKSELAKHPISPVRRLVDKHGGQPSLSLYPPTSIEELVTK